MSYTDRETLFVFFDESGNFDFSNNGTKYWSITALCTFHPREGRERFTDLRYEMADAGEGQECFHATEDMQAVRDRVFGLLVTMPESFDVHSALAEKRKVPPSLRSSPEEFYGYMCKRTIRYLVGLDKYKNAKKWVFVFSSIFNKTKQEALIGDLKKEIQGKLKIPYWIYFNGTKHDINSQIVDYCCWAVAIKWTRGERRPYDLIRHLIVGEEFLFGPTGTDYY